MVIDCNPNDFIYLKVVEVCFIAQNMACFSACSMSLKKAYSAFIDGQLHAHELDPVG